MDMTKFLLKCLSYAPPQYANHLLYSLRTILHLENFLMFGKKVILFQSIKREYTINKKLPTGAFIANLLKINGKIFVQLNFQLY